MSTGPWYHRASDGGGVVGCGVALSRASRLRRIGVREKESAPGMRASCGISAVAQTGGIIDSGALVRPLADAAQKSGIEFLFGHQVTSVQEKTDHIDLLVGAKRISAELMVNCAGLYADKLAHMLGVGRSYAILPFRGEYFAVRRSVPPLIRSMVYPAPDPAFPFLGVHLTAAVDGTVLIGPNAVLALGREAYSRFSFHPVEMLEQLLWKGTRQLLKDPHVRRSAMWELR